MAQVDISKGASQNYGINLTQDEIFDGRRQAVKRGRRLLRQMAKVINADPHEQSRVARSIESMLQDGENQFGDPFKDAAGFYGWNYYTRLYTWLGDARNVAMVMDQHAALHRDLLKYQVDRVRTANGIGSLALESERWAERHFQPEVLDLYHDREHEKQLLRMMLEGTPNERANRYGAFMFNALIDAYAALESMPELSQLKLRDFKTDPDMDAHRELFKILTREAVKLLGGTGYYKDYLDRDSVIMEIKDRVYYRVAFGLPPITLYHGLYGQYGAERGEG